MGPLHAAIVCVCVLDVDANGPPGSLFCPFPKRQYPKDITFCPCTFASPPIRVQRSPTVQPQIGAQ